MYALRHPERYQQLVILDTFLHNDLPDWGLFCKVAKIRSIGEMIMGIAGESIAKSGLGEVPSTSQILQKRLCNDITCPVETLIK